MLQYFTKWRINLQKLTWKAYVTRILNPLGLINSWNLGQNFSLTKKWLSALRIYHLWVEFCSIRTLNHPGKAPHDKWGWGGIFLEFLEHFKEDKRTWERWARFFKIRSTATFNSNVLHESWKKTFQEHNSWCKFPTC